MSTTSTILALFLMPLCLFVYGSGWIEVSIIGQMIPFGGVVLSLFLTLLPVGVGIAIKARYDKIAGTILKVSIVIELESTYRNVLVVIELNQSIRNMVTSKVVEQQL